MCIRDRSDSLYQAFQAPYLGGEQEREKRPGTENLPYALGLAYLYRSAKPLPFALGVARRRMQVKRREMAMVEMCIRDRTDTMPQWAGSSWYFLRYMDPHCKDAIASKEALEYWSPVDWYNGGMEPVSYTHLTSPLRERWHRAAMTERVFWQRQIA